jgi:hypothetical protein
MYNIGKVNNYIGSLKLPWRYIISSRAKKLRNIIKHSCYQEDGPIAESIEYLHVSIDNKIHSHTTYYPVTWNLRYPLYLAFRPTPLIRR